MNAQTEELKAQLLEITDVVNAFKSEAVQLRVLDKLLQTITGQPISHEAETSDHGGVRVKKKPGATKILYQLLATDFFDEPRSIADVADYCYENFQSNFKTSELSGILLKLAKENRLVRQRSRDNNRFEYVKSAA